MARNQTGGWRLPSRKRWYFAGAILIGAWSVSADTFGVMSGCQEYPICANSVGSVVDFVQRKLAGDYKARLKELGYAAQEHFQRAEKATADSEWNTACEEYDKAQDSIEKLEKIDSLFPENSAHNGGQSQATDFQNLPKEGDIKTSRMTICNSLNIDPKKIEECRCEEF